jgi:hypothetical protein
MPWGQIPLPLSCFPTGTRRIAMKRAWNSNYAYALLVWLSVFSCGLYASTLMDRSRASKTHAGSEPFATFHLLDRQVSLLGRQSAVLQKTVSSPQPGNLKAAKPAWRSAANEMGQTVNTIEKLAHSLQRRYRGKPFARRLFGRLSARAASVQSALRVVRSADSPLRASTAASKVDKGIVALGLEYNAITGGYAALHCAPGEWTCCEPKRQGEASSPDACRWLCTKKAQRCRGFVGLRAAGQK